MNLTIALFSSLSFIFLVGIGMGITQFKQQVIQQAHERQIEQERLLELATEKA